MISRSVSLGKVDVKRNITRDQLVMRMKRADWDDVLSTNLTAAFLYTREVMGPML